MTLLVDVKHHGSRTKPRDFDLGSIKQLDREDCIVRWRTMFGASPPKYTSVEFMRKVLAHEAQIKAFGGHSKVVQKVFKASLKPPLRYHTKDKCSYAILPNLREESDVAVEPHYVINADIQTAIYGCRRLTSQR